MLGVCGDVGGERDIVRYEVLVKLFFLGRATELAGCDWLDGGRG